MAIRAGQYCGRLLGLTAHPNHWRKRRATMTNKRKREIVVSAPVILQVVSRHPKPTNVEKAIWRTVIGITAMAFIIGGITTGQPQIMVGMLFGGILIGGCLLMVVNRVLSSRENPLIFTRTGISAGPYINELWEDIESFRLIEANDGRIAMTKTGIGTSLLLKTKGLSQRTIGRAGSLFPILGYFFDNQQQESVMRIFTEFGITSKN